MIVKQVFVTTWKSYKKYFNIEIQTSKLEQASMTGSLDSCVLYYKNIMIVNDTSIIIRSDAPSCGITYNRHSDDSRGVIYAPREHL